LQARVLQARSEIVTTLIAQIVRFARPNIQIYDMRFPVDVTVGSASFRNWPMRTII
jgi:hypothetical protein